MAITYHGISVVPTDNAASVLTITAVTPPASMVAGDLCFFIAFFASGSSSLPSISDDGGQDWTLIGESHNLQNAFYMNLAIYKAVYNGTWDADPSIGGGNAANSMSVALIVFRPTTGKFWDQDAPIDIDIFGGGPGTPYTMTIPGRTCLRPSTVTLAAWFIDDNLTFSNLTGSGWTVTGSAQYRNSANPDDTMTFAHKIQTAVGATGNVSKDQNGVRGGPYFIVTFFEYDKQSTKIIN